MHHNENTLGYTIATPVYILTMPEVIEIPIELTYFQLPEAVQDRLQLLLDRQDEGEALTLLERQEAEGRSFSWKKRYKASGIVGEKVGIFFSRCMPQEKMRP